ncbi:MAG TPA: TIM barrel protein [Patescibacteria group bacterium]|nr:TIM barrel protein [Patescibacteria group bacterium]
MAKSGGYSLNDIYQGGYSSFNSDYGSVFSGYHVSAKNFGLTTDPRTADILKDASAKFATGVKHMEVSAVSPEVFESIPEQHLKEMKRLAKLTGTEISVHAPIVEPSGIGREGFSETNRQAVERQMLDAVRRSHEINPDGNIPVTFHSSASIPQPVTTKGAAFPEETYIINEETGAIGRLPIKQRTFPGEEIKKGEENLYVGAELKKINQDQWSEGIRNMAYYANIGEREIKDYELLTKHAEAERAKGKIITEAETEAENLFNRGTSFLSDSYRQLQNMFEIANKYGSESDRKILNEFANKIRDKAEDIKKIKDLHKSAELRREIIDEGARVFNQIGELPPQIYKPLDEFAREKTVQSFADVAFNAFSDKKIGNFDASKTPIISIENPPAGGAFSRGSELKDVVEKSREKFIDLAVDKGMDRKEAKAAAEKIIGVTWDVGHINMLRKYGYKSEDIVKETEAVKPLIKHIHLSDNFGLEHTELPMGMGNVPLKEIMEKIGAKGDEVKKIIEAGNWWQHFKTPPFQETLEAFGSPIYGMKMAPYWNQYLGLEQGYYGGLAGQWLPQNNYDTFGGGFSQLPSELGGQRAGAQGSRMSGRGME